MERPTIGAALTIELLPTYRDWLIEEQRDLEIQSLHFLRCSIATGGPWSMSLETA